MAAERHPHLGMSWVDHDVPRGAAWGLAGGVVGTIVMDVVLIGVLSAMRLPPLACFTIVGDTAAAFFALVGLDVAGGVSLGVAMHYLLGPLLGALFGAAMARAGALRTSRRLRCVLLGILYVEMLSQPILATSPILLKMTMADTLQWFGVSAAMHLIWGAVLGLLVSYGQRR